MLDRAAGDYLETVQLVEALRYRLRLSIKAEMDQHRLPLDAQQALMLFGIGDNECRATDLTSRAIYLGTNASYNLKKLVDGGFIDHRRATVDRREVRIRLTEKGMDVARHVRTLLHRQAELVGTSGVKAADLSAMNQAMARLVTLLVHRVAFRM